jgi:hypothetical protein
MSPNGGESSSLFPPGTPTVEAGKLEVQPGGCRGECDACHQDDRVLYFIDDQPGEWLYCHSCAYRLARRAERKRP